ncbi:MAG: DNA polymerase Y family protein [Chloroflexota bacterium]|nr:DNA polymerase Y family protein [Chloroflexota bacterium]MDE2918300.1 DNA polymerase Y family protein [Chloroflexota bacterium]
MDRKTLCLWIPRFRTTVEAQTQPSWSALPLAIYARQANQRRLIEVSEAAEAAGLLPGMAVKEAAQRCPEGVYVPDDPPRYAQAFEAVLDVLDRFSPVVEDAGVGLAFADAAGLEPLYGPDAALGARVRRHVEAATGQAAQVGLATGRLAAEIAARTAGDAAVAAVSGDDRAYLAGQPVDRLPLDERTLRQLRILGMSMIGAFADLPINAVRTRYGTEGAQAWRLARGEDPHPPRGRPRPLILNETIDFEWEEHNVDRLTFALQALAQRLAARLARRGLMAQQVGSRIERGDGTFQRFTLALPEPSGSAARLRDAARWRLEAWVGDVQAGAAVQEIPLHRPGVVHICLNVEQLVPGAGTQRSLLGNRSERVARANHAISRLRAQLGDDAIFRMEICPGAWTLETAARRVDAYVETNTQRVAPTTSPVWLAGLSGARGLTRLFTPPRAVHVSRIDGASRVTLDGTTRKVVARYGPQRVRTEWWAEPVDRDYLHVRLDDGRGLALYRDRAQGRWFAQGALD